MSTQPEPAQEWPAELAALIREQDATWRSMNDAQKAMVQDARSIAFSYMEAAESLKADLAQATAAARAEPVTLPEHGSVREQAAADVFAVMGGAGPAAMIRATEVADRIRAAARAEVARQVREYIDQLEPVVPMAYDPDPKEAFEGGFGWALDAILDWFDEHPWIGGRPWTSHGADGKPLAEMRPPPHEDAAPRQPDLCPVCGVALVPGAQPHDHDAAEYRAAPRQPEPEIQG